MPERLYGVRHHGPGSARAVVQELDRQRPDVLLVEGPPEADGLVGWVADAGLRRVTVSLDALDDATFRALNDVDFPVDRVLEGIDAAVAVGLPVKVNAVVKRGVNDDQIVPMAAFFKENRTTSVFPASSVRRGLSAGTGSNPRAGKNRRTPGLMTTRSRPSEPVTG